MKVYILTMNSTYANESADNIIIGAYISKSKARQKLMKLYDEEIKNQAISESFEKDSFLVRHDNYSDDRTSCKIEEVEVI